MIGKVCGMCGNYNGEQRFEFRTPEGKLIRTVQQPKIYDPELKFYKERHFGNSWFVPSNKCRIASKFYLVFSLYAVYRRIGEHSDNLFRPRLNAALLICRVK